MNDELAQRILWGRVRAGRADADRALISNRARINFSYLPVISRVTGHRTSRDLRIVDTQNSNIQTVANVLRGAWFGIFLRDLFL